MKQTLAIQRLNELEKKGRYVFIHRDLVKIFYEDSPRSPRERRHEVVN